jgi:hypothetical protein
MWTVKEGFGCRCTDSALNAPDEIYRRRGPALSGLWQLFRTLARSGGPFSPSPPVHRSNFSMSTGSANRTFVGHSRCIRAKLISGKVPVDPPEGYWWNSRSHRTTRKIQQVRSAPASVFARPGKVGKSVPMSRISAKFGVCLSLARRAEVAKSFHLKKGLSHSVTSI